MGDRANCIVYGRDDDAPVWLYTHWAGTELLETVQTAIKRRERWDDPAYLTRIIFDTMTQGQQGGETGYGISTTEQDNGHDFVVVDPRTQEVRVEDPETRVPKRKWSFEAFCDADLGVVTA